MYYTHPLKEIVAKQKKRIPAGIYSACTANKFVIEAAMERALQFDEFVLVEATANQVNQFGGYTGMQPADFKNFVFGIAEKVRFPKEKIILGGDHLGPLTWKNESSQAALKKAIDLIKSYVHAGFTKIHIDTSMHLADDDGSKQLDNATIASRGAILCKAAEDAYQDMKKKDPSVVPPVYVIGSEVPVPGGIQDEGGESIQVTKARDFEDTVNTFRKEFLKQGLENAWENVIAVVVQPGVEFGDETIHKYDRNAAKELCSSLSRHPGIVFEGHSTDYQTREALKEMVEDGIAILKVGPALTFALREGLFALNYIENELYKYDSSVKLSNFIQTLDDVMVRDPSHWKKYYHGSENSLRIARKYSYSDRCRYYLPLREVRDSIDCLLRNLSSKPVPMTLISQFMPVQYNRIRNGELANNPESLLKNVVVQCIDDYRYAATP
ncbi:MAG: class II D-tagatose-bisphosphate aldolase non-catalytic subunit [Bacillota bacterium]